MSGQQLERLPQRQMEQLEKLAQLIRYYILVPSTAAGSGHPTSSLSATEFMTGLLFGGILRYDLDNPQHPNNDRFIFSKGGGEVGRRGQGLQGKRHALRRPLIGEDDAVVERLTGLGRDCHE